MGLLVFIIVWITLTATEGALAQNKKSTHVQVGVDATAVHSDGLPSWVDGSAGKFAHHGTEVSARAYLELEHRLTDTLTADLMLEVTGDSIGDPLNVTEAYLFWAPVPSSETRYRIRFGTFYPGISLENTLPGWRSPYTINYSVINTWIAEELRATGIEVTALRRLSNIGPNHRLILQASAFGWNDPVGTILSWRGWAIHDRQTRIGDNLPLQALPLNQPGEMFQAQAPFIEPFEELDDRLGIYSAAEWNVRGKLALKGMYYDNQADPEILKNGQYAWRTRFWSFGLKLALPEQMTLLTQWMNGNTVMGPEMPSYHAVDNNFDSVYFLLSKKYEKHRFSARYERFRVDDVDETIEDNNNEEGSAWTLSHRYQFSNQLKVSAEFTRIETNRAGWIFNGFNKEETEKQFQIALYYLF